MHQKRPAAATATQLTIQIIKLWSRKSESYDLAYGMFVEVYIATELPQTIGTQQEYAPETTRNSNINTTQHTNHKTRFS